MYSGIESTLTMDKLMPRHITLKAQYLRSAEAAPQYRWGQLQMQFLIISMHLDVQRW